MKTSWRLLEEKDVAAAIPIAAAVSQQQDVHQNSRTWVTAAGRVSQQQDVS